MGSPTKGLLITFSGIDGCGKSTQVDRLRAYYETIGSPTVTLWTRAGYTAGSNLAKKLIRRVFHRSFPQARGSSEKREEMLQNRFVQSVWLTVAIFDLIRIYGLIIRWYLLRGHVVLCDRYVCDALIDFRLLFPALAIERSLLWRVLKWMSPEPHLAVLLILPLAESERRCGLKRDPFPDSPEKKRKRGMAYEQMASASHGNCCVLDAAESETQLASRILAAVTAAAGLPESFHSSKAGG